MDIEFACENCYREWIFNKQGLQNGEYDTPTQMCPYCEITLCYECYEEHFCKDDPHLIKQMLAYKGGK